MEDRSAAKVVRPPELPRLFAGDPFFERAQKLNDLIARRAYELFEFSGFTHGHDHEHWLRAESEILHPCPLALTETESEFILLAEVPGFSEQELEVRVEPRRLFVVDKRQEVSEWKQGKNVYSERQGNHIFRVLDLPAAVDRAAVHATLSDGLLEVRLLKAETGKKIPVLTRAASA